MTGPVKKNAPDKVLFISHNAGRNGAPLMLLNLLRRLREQTDFEIEILLREPGPLQEDFAALAPTFVFRFRPGNALSAALCDHLPGAGAFFATRHRRRLVRHFHNTGIRLIYANTITNGDILEALAPLGCAVITHVHELEGWIRQAGADNLRQVMSRTSQYIAASGACKDNLIERHGLDHARIEVVHSFIPTPSPAADPGKIRAALGIPPDAFVILGSGHEGWKKGKDLFVQLAGKVGRELSGRMAHFIWVGGWETPREQAAIDKMIQEAGLAETVHFVGQVDNPLDYFAAGDIFALVSREDTFPLVCLEAAALGKPILCFAGSGGMPEFVETDAGCIVPHLDLETMSEKIALLASDAAARNRLGARAAEKALNDYDLGSGSRRIEAIIRQQLAAEPGTGGPC